MGSGGCISVPGLETIRTGGAEAVVALASSANSPSVDLNHYTPKPTGGYAPRDRKEAAQPKAMQMLDEFPLRSTDGIAKNLYMYLWAKNSQGCSCPGIRIPQTVVYSDRSPEAWIFYSTKEKSIMRKKPQNLNAATIAEAFSKPASKDGSHAAGSVTWIPGDFEETTPIAYQASQGASVLHLDSHAMRQWVLGAQKPRVGVLQKYVDTRDGRNSAVRADWTPQLCLLERRTNRNPVNSEKLELQQRLATFDGAEHHSESNPIAGSVLPALVREMCNNIVEHVLDVSLGKFQIVRMVLDFKVDANQNLNLLYCSSLRILGDSPDSSLGSGRAPLSPSPYLPHMAAELPEMHFDSPPGQAGEGYFHGKASRQPRSSPAPPAAVDISLTASPRKVYTRSRAAPHSVATSPEVSSTGRTLSAGSRGTEAAGAATTFICALDGELHDTTDRHQVTYKMLLLMVEHEMHSGTYRGHPDAIPAAIQRADPIMSLDKYSRICNTHDFLYRKASVCRGCSRMLTLVAKEHIALQDAEQGAIRTREEAERRHLTMMARDQAALANKSGAASRPFSGSSARSQQPPMITTEPSFSSNMLPSDFPSALLPKQGHILHAKESSHLPPQPQIAPEDSRQELGVCHSIIESCHEEEEIEAAGASGFHGCWDSSKYDALAAPDSLSNSWEEDEDTDGADDDSDDDRPEDPVLRAIRRRIASAGGSAEAALSSWLAKEAPKEQAQQEGTTSFSAAACLAETMAHAAALLGVGPDGADLPPRVVVKSWSASEAVVSRTGKNTAHNKGKKPLYADKGRRAASAAPQGFRASRAKLQSRELTSSVAVRRNAVSEDGSPEDVLAAAGIMETDGDEWDDDEIMDVMESAASDSRVRRPRISSATRQQRPARHQLEETTSTSERQHGSGNSGNGQYREQDEGGALHPAPFEVPPPAAAGKVQQQQEPEAPGTHSNRIDQMRAIYLPPKGNGSPSKHTKVSKSNGAATSAPPRAPSQASSGGRSHSSSSANRTSAPKRVSSTEGAGMPSPRRLSAPEMITGGYQRSVLTAPLGAKLTADERWLLGEAIASPRGSTSVADHP